MQRSNAQKLLFFMLKQRDNVKKLIAFLSLHVPVESSQSTVPLKKSMFYCGLPVGGCFCTFGNCIQRFS